MIPSLSTAGRGVALALALSLSTAVGPAVAADADLPRFPGDGYDEAAPALAGTYSRAALPDVRIQAGHDAADAASLLSVLDIQAKVASRIKDDAAFALDGLDRPVTRQDFMGAVDRLKAWHGSGKPLQSFVTPYLLRGDGHGNVRFTGYLTPTIRVSDTPSDIFSTPVYRKPAALPDPPPTRHEINAGALAGRGLELAWTDSRIDLFFLQVQGSGYGAYPDGRRTLLSYGGKNGHPYASIGKHLVALGEIPVERISLQSIKEWFAAHPERADEIMDVNPAYLFFVTDQPAVVGAAGVPVTPLRTVAADSATLPLGSMILIEMPVLDAEGRVASREYRIMAVQDRGGAIKGTGRIDIYAGGGAEAERLVGGLKHFGRVWLLLPKA